MDIRRIVLYMALALIGLSLWNAWQIDYPAKQPVSVEDKAAGKLTSDGHLLPQIIPSNAEQAVTLKAEENASNSNQLIQVKTDVLDVDIDLRNGDIVKGLLLDYPLSVEDKNKPFPLLQNQSSERYVANSSLFVLDGQKPQSLDFDFKSEKEYYELKPDQNQLIVTLNGKNEDGLDVKRNLFLQKEVI